MQWRGRRGSDNVEDRRGMGGRSFAVGGSGFAVGGLGTVGTIVVLLIILLGGGDPSGLPIQTAPQGGLSQAQQEDD